MIKAVINLEAPREHVFSILTNYPRYTEWLPGCEKCSIVTSTGNTVDTQITVSGMKKMTMGLRFEAVPTQVLNFRMYSGKDIKAYSGSYRLMDSADGKGTVVVAEMEIDAGAMVPKFMVDRIAKKSIDDTSAALKQFVKKVPIQPGTAAPAPSRPVVAKPRRAKRILVVVKKAEGYRVWMMGETFDVKSKA